jgi:hypothetical protein
MAATVAADIVGISMPGVGVGAGVAVGVRGSKPEGPGVKSALGRGKSESKTVVIKKTAAPASTKIRTTAQACTTLEVAASRSSVKMASLLDLCALRARTE